MSLGMFRNGLVPANNYSWTHTSDIRTQFTRTVSHARIQVIHFETHRQATRVQSFTRQISVQTKDRVLFMHLARTTPQ